MDSDIGHWIRSIPVFTRYWFVSSIAFSLIGRFGIIHWHNFALLHTPFIKNFEIWRSLTCVLYQHASFHLLMNLYFIYQYSMRLESIEFANRPADYLYLLLFSWVVNLCAGLLLQFPLLQDCMILTIIYVWCQLNKDAIVHFWFGVQFKAMYLPWVLFAFSFIIGHAGLQELVGIFTGHLYFFLKFKYPQDFGGPSLLSTPSILEYYFPPRGSVRGFGTAPMQQQGVQPRGGGGHSWGRGQALGR